jgi:hypothetical protein
MEPPLKKIAVAANTGQPPTPQAVCQFEAFFKLADKNGDGKLSRAEIVKCCKSDPSFAQFVGLPPTIGDAQRSALETFFQAADADGDKRISPDEFATHFTDRVPPVDPAMTAMWFYKVLCSPPSELHHFEMKRTFDERHGAGSFATMIAVVDQHIASLDFSAVPVAIACSDLFV